MQTILLEPHPEDLPPKPSSAPDPTARAAETESPVSVEWEFMGFQVQNGTLTPKRGPSGDW